MPDSPKQIRQDWRPENWLFGLMIIVGVIIHWLAHYPPMTDLPQNAGQIALLRDTLLGTPLPSAAPPLTLHLMRPYLLGYLSGALLSIPFGVLIGMKLLLSLIFIGYALAFRYLRRTLGGSGELDCLALVGYFGFTWHWGLLNFLFAAPLMFVFLADSFKYLNDPQHKRALWILLLGGILFFAHALLFGFALLIIGLWGLAKLRKDSWSHLPRLIWPFAIWFVLGAIYVAAFRPPSSDNDMIIWGLGIGRLHRLLVFPIGVQEASLTIPLFIFLAALPFMMGASLEKFRLKRYAPLLAFAMLWSILPHQMMGTIYVFQRFIIFFFPFYALCFSFPPTTSLWTKLKKASLIATTLLPLGSAAYAVLQFDGEAKGAVQILENLPVNRRIATLSLDKSSPAMNDPNTYLHFASWYQAEKSGWTEFNFAIFPYPLFSYTNRADQALTNESSWESYRFDFVRHRGRSLDYFLVREKDGFTENDYAQLFKNPDCKITLAEHQVPWRLYKNEGCSPPHTINR